MWVLLSAVLLLSGHFDYVGAMFETKAECEENIERVEQSIVEWNKSKADKVVQMATVCVPFQKAPQGEPV